MSEIKLLPCPFCGGKAETVHYTNGWDEWWHIKCTSCKISQTGYTQTKEQAIGQWNTRKPMQEIVEKLEELYKYNSEQAEVYMDGEDSYMREKKEMYMDRANCYGVAIRTVKEVGGMNESEKM